MNHSSLDIPNIRTRKVGSSRDQIEFVDAVLRLEAWDGYLVKRWENGRAITDGTIILNFACTSESAAEDWETQVAAYRRLLEEQFAIRDSIVNYLRDNFDTLKETYYLDPDDDPDVPASIELPAVRNITAWGVTSIRVSSVEPLTKLPFTSL